MLESASPLARRELLTRAGLAVAAAGWMGGQAIAQGPSNAPKPTQPQPGPKPADDAPPLPPDQRIGIAIVGIGDFASNQIIPSFGETRRCRLAGFVTGDPAKGQKFAQDFGVKGDRVYTYDQMDRLAEASDIDAIYVITPNATHRKYVEAGVKAGKHVLCEKPMATNSKDAEAMIKACKDAGKLLMIAYRAQYEPFNEKAIALCRSGQLGRIVSVTSDHGRILKPEEKQDKWRADKELAGGGSLPDIGIYSLQAARYLTGEEPVEITAYLHQPKDDPRFREVEATVHWTMRFPSGALANCSSSYDWNGTKRAQVYGSKGTLVLDPVSDYYEHTLKVTRTDTDGKTPIIEDHKITERNQFARMMDHFAECVKENKTPRTPGEEGLRDLRYIEAIYESAKNGGKPVRV